MSNKDYIIFDKAPIITFTCSSPMTEWYASTYEESERLSIPGTLTTSNCPSNYILKNLNANIKIRGNYTANYSKKAFQIKFEEKQNLFGLNNNKKFKKWILLAEYNDSSMLRNALALYMARHLCEGAWSADFTFAHLYINDGVQNYYMGLYLLVDQKEQSKNRVNVFEPEDGYEGTDIGYFFERDDYALTDTDPYIQIFNYDYYHPMFYSGHESDKWARRVNGKRVNYDLYGIKSKITNESQIAFLKERIIKIQEILYRAAYENTLYEIDDNNNLTLSSETDPAKALGKSIDLKSFIDFYILHEIVCNPDIGHSSFYLSLDMSSEGNKLFTLNCPWDYDLALGIAKGFAENPISAELWAKQAALNPWISLLTKADWFKELVDKRWQELYDNYFMCKCFILLDDYSETYEKEFKKNFTEWDIVWNNNKTWNLDLPDKKPTNFVKDEYTEVENENDCKILLSSWLNNRFITLHSLFNGQGSTDWPEPPVPPVPPGPDPHHKDIPIWEKANNEHRYQFRGLSTDPKPSRDTWVNLGNGSILIEMDTAKLFMYDEENDVWYEL